MSIFATEFPVRSDISQATFFAEAIAWVRGISNSTVLNNVDQKELYDDDARIVASSGEILAFKKVIQGDYVVVGVRHELPDSNGRVWRTECVLTKQKAKAYFRVRGQCVGIEHDAAILRPRKPHLIRQAIEEKWSEKDGSFTVQAEAHYITETDLDFARKLIQGEEETLLPCIYVSRNNDNTLPIDEGFLSKKLAGLAHVVIEPTRGFSFSLMEVASRKNPYGGAIGIFVPQKGEVQRF